MQSDFQVHHFRDVIRIIRKHFWISALAGLAMLVGATCVVLFAPRKYQSYARYMIRLGRESVSLDPTATVGETMGLYVTNDSVVKSTKEILASETVATKVVKQVGADNILRGTSSTGKAKEPGLISRMIGSAKGVISNIDPISNEEKAKIKFQESLGISLATQSNVLMVDYTSKSPQHSYAVMNAVSEVFLNEHRRVNRTEGSFEFFEDQYEVLAEQLNDATEALKTAKQKYGIASVDGKRKDLENRLSLAEQSQQEIERRLAVSKIRINALTEQLKQTPDKIVLSANEGNDNQSAAAVRQQFYALQVREKELASSHQPNHPSLVAIQEQLADMAEIFKTMNLSDTKTSRGSNPVHQQLTLQLLKQQADDVAFKAEATVVERQRQNIRRELTELATQEQEIFHLQTTLDCVRSKFESHSSKTEQARLENALNEESITSIGVIEYPLINERPVSPNKKIVALLGLFAAIGSIICLPFVIEYLRHDPLDESFVDPAFTHAHSTDVHFGASGVHGSEANAVPPPKSTVGPGVV